MKRRIVSFLLCVAMIFTGILATGCAGEGDDSLTTETGDEGSALIRSSMTLTLWVPTESEMNEETEEALELVEEAINKITQAEYDTAIKLYAIPTDEYEDAVKKQMQDITDRKEKAEKEAAERRKAEREAAKRGETLPPLITNKDDESVNPYDLIVDSGATYPHVEKNQMDIFLIRGYEDYRYYVDNMFVESLDDEINGTSKVLKSYIYPDFFEAAKVDGMTYGIPNNHALGEYTYLLVNKELATKYNYTQNDLMNIAYCQSFIEKVAAGEAGVTPVWGNITPAYMQYWSGQDSKSFSVLASEVKPTDTSTPDKKVAALEAVEFKNVFDITSFVDNTYYQKLYTEKGYISTAESVDKFGVGIVTATPGVVEELYADEYYVNTHQAPEGSLDDYCASMFAISTHTKDKARAMEIITRLNTETDLRTILQYGVEGEHWKYDELDDSIIVKLSDTYKMNLADTGNVYMTYPDYETPMNWDSAKAQNLESFYPVTYYLTNYVHEGNSELIAELDAYNAEMLERIEKLSAAEFKDSVSKLKKEVSEKLFFAKLNYVPSSSDAQKGLTEENGYIVDNSIPCMWKEAVELIKEG